MSSSSVEWRVSVGVQWSGWHIAKAKVTEDTHTATAASQKVVLTSGARWMSCPAERLALAEVMPQAGRHTGEQGGGDTQCHTRAHLGLGLSAVMLVMLQELVVHSYHTCYLYVRKQVQNQSIVMTAYKKDTHAVWRHCRVA